MSNRQLIIRSMNATLQIGYLCDPPVVHIVRGVLGNYLFSIVKIRFQKYL